ncbi:MAG: hypothetical protein JSS81_11285 [Acidobacteria bacterium]|nr:hypothetical protein [Acidobacteriota bacterium]
MLRKNTFNLILTSLVALGLALGCMSREEAEKWREKELRAQDERADLAKRGDEYAKYAAPEKLVAEPYVREKIVVVYTWADGRNEIREDDINRVKSHAQKAGEEQSVFKVKCREVPAGEYVFERSNRKVPAFSARCETELYDQTIPALIYRKTFENKDLKESIRIYDGLQKPPDKVVAPNPEREILDFLYELPRK